MGFGPAERRSALHPPWKFLLKKQEFTVLQYRDPEKGLKNVV
jgi:hypothetical protein